MGMNKNLKRLVMGVVATSMLMGCGAIEKTASDEYASIGKTKITKVQIDKVLELQINGLKEQYGEDYEEKIEDEIKEGLKDARQHVTESLVEMELIKIKAKELNLISSEAEIDEIAEENINKIKGSYPDQDSFDQALKANGYADEQSFRDKARDQVIFDKVLEHIIKDVSVTDEDVKKYYEDNKDKEFVKQAGAEVRHILFKEEEEAAAKELKAKIDAGTSFDELFKEYEGNKVKDEYPIAEDLSFVLYSQPNFDPAFLEGLKPLKEGEISEPVKSSFGYHIIEAKNVADGTTAEPFENVEDTLKPWLLQKRQVEAYKEKISEWEKEEKVRYNEDLLIHERGQQH